MRIERVLSVDPGKLTGVAYLERCGDTVAVLWTAEINIFSEDALRIRGIIKDWNTYSNGTYPLRVVIERFIITVETGKKSQEASSALEAIGAMKLLCCQANYPLDAIVYQKPADAKTAFPNAKLKALGLWHVGGRGHALDALRHSALYLLRSGLVETQKIS
jgi:hypothetical protein